MSQNISDLEIKEFQKELEEVDIITIDESSFIGIKAICILDYVLKKISNKDKPFGGYKILFFGDYQQLSCVKDYDVFKPRNTEEIEKILSEDWQELAEYDEEENGFDDNEKVNYNIIDAINDMGGYKVNIDQNNEKVCLKIIDKTRKDKNKEENIKKFKNSLEEF